MALIKCPECGHDVSTLAERCPNCGAPVAAMIQPGAARRPAPPPGWAAAPPPLPANERVIFATRLHWVIFVPPVLTLIGAVILALLVIGQPGAASIISQAPGTVERALQTLVFVFGAFSMLWLLVRAVVWSSASITLTDRRLTAQQGFLSRHSTDIPLSKVESVSVNQNLIGQVFHYGTVIVTGSGGTQERFHGIAYARELSSAVQMQIGDSRPASEGRRW